MFKNHFYSHNFANILDPSCNCGHSRSQTNKLFFQCPLTSDIRLNLLNDIHGLLHAIISITL
jgi:hypothetical protein